MTELIALIIGICVPLFSIGVYYRKKKLLYRELDSAAKLLVRKDRELTRANQDLKERNAELTEATKTLVRRDLELTRSNERLIEADELKSEFVSTAAHQLRTPLTAIKWSLNELSNEGSENLTGDQQRLLSDMIDATNRLIDLINGLLNVSRLEEGRASFEMETQDIMPVLLNMQARFKKVAEEKGVTFLIEAPEAPPNLTFDREKMQIAFSNLVDNAIKYTPPGGTVTIAMDVEEDRARISVSDTGIGIPPDQASYIFNRFFRAHNAKIMETYGSGLGLSVARDIVERHDGTLTFESEEGAGTTFTITLPVT